MAHELNLDQLSENMKKTQNGAKKKMVWDKKKLCFVELGLFEQPSDTQSPLNDVSQRPFYRNI